MNNEWSTYDVAMQHGYLDLTPKVCPHHSSFADWLKQQTSFERSVVDIGCCSGHVLDFIGKDVVKYLGIDFSKSSIEFANEHRRTDFHQFVNLNVEIDDLPITHKEYSICYIDSVITMVNSPTRLLFKLAPYFHCIFLNRTTLSNQTNLSFHRWAGMNCDSPLWRFSADYFLMIGNETGYNYIQQISDNQLVLTRKNQLEKE